MRKKATNKHTHNKARAARMRGYNAEIRFRNMLRTIYPEELQDMVQRVPLSGAANFKCDVSDLNDPMVAYEVKWHKTVTLPNFWRQTKSQAGKVRTPVLVFGYTTLPFHVVMRLTDLAKLTERDIILRDRSTEKLENQLKRLNLDKGLTGLKVMIDGDECAIIPIEVYIHLKSIALKKD